MERKVLIRWFKENNLQSFLSFLGKENFNLWFENLEYNTVGSEKKLNDKLRYFLKYKENLVRNAFMWADTEQGHSFWSNIDDEWRIRFFIFN